MISDEKWQISRKWEITEKLKRSAIFLSCASWLHASYNYENSMRTELTQTLHDSLHKVHFKVHMLFGTITVFSCDPAPLIPPQNDTARIWFTVQPLSPSENNRTAVYDHDPWLIYINTPVNSSLRASAERIKRNVRCGRSRQRAHGICIKRVESESIRTKSVNRLCIVPTLMSREITSRTNLDWILKSFRLP